MPTRVTQEAPIVPESSQPRGAIFLDRDGVLNDLVLRDGHWVSPRRVADVRLSTGVVEAIERARGLAMPLFIATNQPDIARGLLEPDELAAMMERIRAHIAVDDVAICPHDDADRCACRKPAPGLLTTLAARWGVDLRHSFMVGDSWKDVEAGRRAGCRTILIDRAGAGARSADHTVASLAAAIDVIEAQLALPPSKCRP